MSLNFHIIKFVRGSHFSTQYFDDIMLLHTKDIVSKNSTFRIDMSSKQVTIEDDPLLSRTLRTTYFRLKIANRMITLLVTLYSISSRHNMRKRRLTANERRAFKTFPSVFCMISEPDGQGFVYEITILRENSIIHLYISF